MSRSHTSLRKRFLRLVATLTLAVFVSLQITEALHNLCKTHVEAHCAICQIAHQVSAAGQSGLPFKTDQTFSRIVPEERRLLGVAHLPDQRSRSPPQA